MDAGFLSQYFDEVVVKRLSVVEVDTSKSNQHEFNGTLPLRRLFGDYRLSDYPAQFIWLGEENEGFTEGTTVTWYDARENHPTRTEYRLYFKSNPVMDLASAGDLLIVARQPSGDLYFIVAPANSTIEQQLIWLFDLPEDIGPRFEFKAIGDDILVDYAVRYILEELGIEVQDPEVGLLDTFLEPYIESGFPTTKEFSTLARRITRDVGPVEDPDDTLLCWMDMEERLFKRLERHMIGIRLEKGFYEGSDVDVDGFISFSLSVQNRRKSRVGYALENHLEEIFRLNEVRCSRTRVTEHRSKPDFLFPGVNEYRDPKFLEERLTMLGVKSTCKDRWRQVLSEAARIREKHLLTLEPGISEHQTDEMRDNHLQLVLPRSLHDTYRANQRAWLMDLKAFVRLVKYRQSSF